LNITQGSFAMTPETFLAKITETGVSIVELRASAGFLKLRKTFPAGDKHEYTCAESDVGIIYSTPSVGAGSVWGTDGGSIGGHVGLTGGYMVLNKSNVAKRWLSALAKIVKIPT